ncbi:hypothetical protein IJ541_04040 [bacterium]|nr:hypothetical protein [bacterium]
MTVQFGQGLFAYIPGVSQTLSTEGATSVEGSSSVYSYKSAGYTSIPYERPPKVEDIVQTKYSDGTPFWADYVTPNKVWTC